MTIPEHDINCPCSDCAQYWGEPNNCALETARPDADSVRSSEMGRPLGESAARRWLCQDCGASGEDVHDMLSVCAVHVCPECYGRAKEDKRPTV